MMAAVMSFRAAGGVCKVPPVEAPAYFRRGNEQAASDQEGDQWYVQAAAFEA
jgi:hypothetical protein